MNNNDATQQIRNVGYGGRTCLDSPAAKKNLKKPVGLYPCHGQGGNQVIIHLFSFAGYRRLGHAIYEEMFNLISITLFRVFMVVVVVAHLLFCKSLFQLRTHWNWQVINAPNDPYWNLLDGKCGG